MSSRNDSIRDLKRISGSVALDFSNTADRAERQVIVERLHTYTDFIEWAAMAEIIDDSQARSLHSMAQMHSAEAKTALTTALKLRELIYRIGSDIASQVEVDTVDIALFNHFLWESNTYRNLEQMNQSFKWVWTWIDDMQTLQYPIWQIVQVTANLLTDATPNVRECGASDCGWLFLDTSRNKSRKWCDMSDCGNREKAKRHYLRSKQS